MLPGPKIHSSVEDFEKWLCDVYIPNTEEDLTECWGVFSNDRKLEKTYHKIFISGLNHAEITDLRGKILSHNHPSEETFSDDDIFTFASLEMMEFRVVSPTQTFSITPVNGKWPPREDIERCIKTIKSTEEYKKFDNRREARDYCLRMLSKQGFFHYKVIPHNKFTNK